MKHILYELLVCLLPVYAYPQGFAINATGANPDSSAMLDVTSTTKGFLMPRMSTTQRNTISFPAQGLLVFNTTTKTFDYYTGSSWISLSNTTVSTGTPKIHALTTSGIWIKPSNLKYIVIEVLGGGGGGGGCYNYGGGAGASGGYAKKILSADTIPASISYIIGSGGTGGTPQSPGGNGGTTSFGTYCFATGGEGGKAQTTTVYSTAGSNPGVGFGGDINLTGSGSGGVTGSSDSPYTGAPSIYGGGAISLSYQSTGAGYTGTSYGAGGSGGYGFNSTGQNGGNGSSGILIITEYY